MSEDQGDFFASAASDQTEDAPIILGEMPPQDDFAGDFASPPSEDDGNNYLGDVNEAPSGDDAPIVLTASDDDAMAMVSGGDPSPMQKWNAEWQETLLRRKEEEGARKAELVEAARIALEQMQQEREHKREAKMGKNREDEQVKLEAIEADLENDNSWQRVCKMIELSHDSSQKTADVKRMRDILIGLKNDTSKALELGA
jgi:hypothetical protein